jgi:hypothetical protein
MTTSIVTDDSLHVNRSSHVARFSGAQSVGSMDESSHAFFKPRIAFQLALLQLLYPQHLIVQLRDICIDLLKAHVTNLLHCIEARVAMGAKCVNIPIDTDYGAAKMLNSRGNTSLKPGESTYFQNLAIKKSEQHYAHLCNRGYGLRPGTKIAGHGN